MAGFATILIGLIRKVDLGKGFVQNPATRLLDVSVSGAIGNTISYDANGALVGGQFKAAINLGDTTPVPAGGAGSLAYSTSLNELVKWVVDANGNGSWGAKYVASSDAGASALPFVTTADNGDHLVVLAGAWAKNPFDGPITSWPALV